MKNEEETGQIRVEQIFGHKGEIEKRMLTGQVTNNTFISYLCGVSTGAVG